MPPRIRLHRIRDPTSLHILIRRGNVTGGIKPPPVSDVHDLDEPEQPLPPEHIHHTDSPLPSDPTLTQTRALRDTNIRASRPGLKLPLLADLHDPPPEEPPPPIHVHVGGPRLNRDPYAQSSDAKPFKRLVNVLAHPTWSVKSLLPPPPPLRVPLSPSFPSTSEPQPEPESDTASSEITSATLAHLCHLSALPPPVPSSPEESALLASLYTHLHFVRHIQSVDTRDVEPLRAIRDESDEFIQSRRGTVELEDPEIQWILGQEKSVGRWGRIVVNGNGEGGEIDGEGKRVEGRYEVRPRRQGQMEDLEGEMADDIVDAEDVVGEEDVVRVEDVGVEDASGGAEPAEFRPFAEEESQVEDEGEEEVGTRRRRRRPPPQRYFFVKTPVRKTE